MNLEALIGRKVDSHFNGTSTILGYFLDRGDVKVVAESPTSNVHILVLEGLSLVPNDFDQSV